MNRILLYVLAAAALLVGCSKDNHKTSSQYDPDAWKYDITLPVPIEFGASALQTKGVLVNDLANAGKFGVFGVDKTDTDLSEYPDALLLNNAEAKFDGGYLTLTERTFYPMTNDRNYNFYAYHALSNTSGKGQSQQLPSEVEVSNGIFVEMPIGECDILYGSTKVTSSMKTTVGYDGYNARYIRKSLNKENCFPSINFRHLTAAIQFSVRANDADAITAFEEEDVRIAQIYLENMPVTAKLCVVDLENDEENAEGTAITNTNEGTFDISESQMGEIYVVNDGGKDLNHLPAEEEEVGHPVYFVPREEAVSGWIVWNAESGLDPIPFTLDPLMPNLQTPGKFTAGYLYNVVLTLHSPIRVKVSVTVDQWKDGLGGEIVLGD